MNYNNIETLAVFNKLAAKLDLNLFYTFSFGYNSIKLQGHNNTATLKALLKFDDKLQFEFDNGFLKPTEIIKFHGQAVSINLDLS